MKALNFIANLIWIIFGGLVAALVWLVTGLVLCVTIVGIPFGIQNFKLARVSLAPFGKKVKIAPAKHIIMNIIWAVLVGWELCITYLCATVVCCISIIGIPLAKQSFKLCKLALVPFGATVEK